MGKKNKASSDANDSTKRIAEPGARHRRQAALVEVKEAPPVALTELGTLHVHTESIIAEGQNISASDTRQLAAEAGDAFGKDFKAQWTLITPWMAVRLKPDASKASSYASNDSFESPGKSVESVHLDDDLRARASAEYAKLWRPTFLATVALAHSIQIGCRAATVSPQTVLNHRNMDPDFDAQVIAAQAYCIELLHATTMRSALEGDLEPVFWQGIRVGHIRKFDNRLRVELLRAHMPQTFKTPGAKVQVNTGNQLFLGSGNVLDQPAMLKLMEMRQISLARIQEKKANAREVGTVPALPVPPTT